MLYEAISRVLEMQSKFVYELLPDKDTQKLVDAMNKSADIVSTLDKDKSKILGLAARAESAFKGFDLPIYGTNAYENLEKFDLTPEEQKEILTTVSETLGKLRDGNIEKKNYPNKVIQDTTAILKNKGISEEKVKNFLTQGDKSKQYTKDKGFENKASKLSLEEKEYLTPLVKEGVLEFEKHLNETTAIAKLGGIQNPETAKKLVPVLLKLNSEEMQEKGTEIVKNFAPLLENKNEKLAKATENMLNIFDPKYLADKSSELSQQLEAVSKPKGIIEMFKAYILRKDVVGEKLEETTKVYKQENENFVKAQRANTPQQTAKHLGTVSPSSIHFKGKNGQNKGQGRG